jgi:hypothetical protein
MNLFDPIECPDEQIDIVEVYGYDNYFVKGRLWQMINIGKLILSIDRRIYLRNDDIIVPEDGK